MVRSAVIVIVIVVVVVIAVLVAGLAKPDLRQHLLGQSSKQQAKVTDINRVGFCSRSNRDTYTLEWEEDGARRTETIGRCGDPYEVGDTVDIWSTDGTPETSPPNAIRLITLCLFLTLGAMAGFGMRRTRRHIRTIDAALAGTWQPIVCRTTGHPDDPRFRIVESPEPVRAEKVRGGRSVHVSSVRPDQSGQVPGTLFLTTVRRGCPKGLTLHDSADGSRIWRHHG